MAGERSDEHFMRAALAEAEKGLGRTSPNPAVGAVLTIGNRIVARGHHAAAGGPHAEIVCLWKFGRQVPPEAMLYVTLEPCSTSGRTPPCSAAVIDAGVRHVVIGALDVNPRHNGRAVAQFQSAGVAVRTGVLAAECQRLNEAFNKWIVTRRPFVIAKCAMSLDGRLTRPRRESRWLSDAAARRHAHELRAQVDAILIGAGTLRSDNPRLTVRGSGRSKQPWRVVLTRSGNLPKSARLFADQWAHRTRVYQGQSLRAVLGELGRDEITSVLLEGGGDLLGQALDARLIDKVQVYITPWLTGGEVPAFGGRGAVTAISAARLRDITYSRVGNAVYLIGYADKGRDKKDETLNALNG